MSENKNEYKFSGKYIIKFNLRVLTGLHIGGTSEGIEIGGIDNPVIKDPISGLPYIPGSSLKGKLRSLLEWAHDKLALVEGKAPPHSCKNKDEIQKCAICRIFGTSASEDFGEPTRLTIRDSYPSEETINNWKQNLGEGIYTEMKSENTIDRITAMATPRTLERVPKDSIFEVEMIYDVYKQDDVKFLKDLFQAMQILEDSFLGGSGSRGSGKVKFENPQITFRSRENYYCKENGQEDSIELKDIKPDDSIPKQLYDKFGAINWILKATSKQNNK
ncbi:MAG: type III-A CRISPR-associated RAMP protein Csm3 [candidate division WOR-3 bacterium]